MKKTRSNYLKKLTPGEIVYESTLDLMEDIGWSHGWFDKLVSFAQIWKSMGRPQRVVGSILKDISGKHGSYRWKLLFDWGGRMQDDCRAVLTPEGQRILNKILMPNGASYAKALEFGRFNAMRIREDLLAKKIQGRIVRSNTGTPTYFVSCKELEEEEEIIVVERPVHKSIHEDLCAARPSRLLELLDKHDCPLLKATIDMYKREKFVPYGVAVNVKNIIYGHAVNI